MEIHEPIDADEERMAAASLNTPDEEEDEAEAEEPTTFDGAVRPRRDS